MVQFVSSFTKEPMLNRTSTTQRVYNPYASGTSTPQTYVKPRTYTTSYVNPYGEAAAAQQDPLAQAITGGSMGGGFNDLVTPTGINTNASGAFQEQTQGKTASGGAVPFNQPPPPPPPAPFNPYASGTSTPQLAPQPSVNNVLPQGSMTPEQYRQVLQMNSGYTGVQPSMTANEYYALTGSNVQRPANQPFNDTVTPTGISTEVTTSAPRDLPTMAEAQAAQIRQPSMTADDYRNILRGEIAGISSNTMTPEDYNRILSGQGDRIVEAVNASRMSPEDYAAILRGETQGIRESMMTPEDYNRILSGAEDRITSAISSSTMMPEDYAAILRGELTARDEQARQAEIAAEQARQLQQSQLDMQRAQATQATNDRMRELLRGYTGGTSAQRDMMMAQATPYQQRQLLQFGAGQMGVPSGATNAQAAMFAAQTPAALADVGGYRSPYADAASAQGGGGATPTYTNTYAAAASQQPDSGLRTYTPGGEQRPSQVRIGQPANTLQQRLEQAYMERIGASDPILASQLADQQQRQQEEERGLVEQLSRYGVLRGGGDTAAVLSRLSEGNERNRLALEAAAAQRRQQDLRDALSFDQARAQIGLAERGQSLQERLGQQDILNQQLSRDTQRAGLTGQFEGQDTLAAQQLRQQMDLAERGTALQEQLGGETILDRQQGRDIAAAGLTGRFGDTDTLAGRELSLREELARTGDLRAQQAAESALFGRVITGTDAPVTTLEGQRTLSDLDTAGLAREATEAGLTGAFRGGATTAERALGSQLASEELARQLQEASVTGQYGGQGTLQSQVLESSLQNEALNRALSRAGATGLFREEGDTGAGTETLESRLRTAGLTGELGGEATLAGRQAEMDQIGAILAALDPAMKNKSDALAAALIGQLGDAEQARIQDSFLSDLDQATNYDDFFRLADKYAGYPSIAKALEEILQEGLGPDETKGALQSRFSKARGEEG
jgi:hypothetical protein